MKKLIFFLPLLFACSHAQPELSPSEISEIAELPLVTVERSLKQIDADLAAMDVRLRTTQSRRDNLRLQQSTDATKQDAVLGAEAEIESLLARRTALQHRKHLLEGRLRELMGEQGK